jgi:hypothetical protein
MSLVPPRAGIPDGASAVMPGLSASLGLVFFLIAPQGH